MTYRRYYAFMNRERPDDGADVDEEDVTGGD
jgi:hypothetical protein